MQQSVRKLVANYYNTYLPLNNYSQYNITIATRKITNGITHNKLQLNEMTNGKSLKKLLQKDKCNFLKKSTNIQFP